MLLYGLLHNARSGRNKTPTNFRGISINSYNDAKEWWLKHWIDLLWIIIRQSTCCCYMVITRDIDSTPSFAKTPTTRTTKRVITNFHIKSTQTHTHTKWLLLIFNFIEWKCIGFGLWSTFMWSAHKLHVKSAATRKENFSISPVSVRHCAGCLTHMQMCTRLCMTVSTNNFIQNYDERCARGSLCNKRETGCNPAMLLTIIRWDIWRYCERICMWSMNTEMAIQRNPFCCHCCRCWRRVYIDLMCIFMPRIIP